MKKNNSSDFHSLQLHHDMFQRSNDRFLLLVVLRKIVLEIVYLLNEEFCLLGCNV